MARKITRFTLFDFSRVTAKPDNDLANAGEVPLYEVEPRARLEFGDIVSGVLIALVGILLLSRGEFPGDSGPIGWFEVFVMVVYVLCGVLAATVFWAIVPHDPKANSN